MKNVKELLIGKKVLQPFFERLFRISLRGMNYGVGGMTDSSGEGVVLGLVRNYFKEKELIVFDIGANVGQYSTMASARLSPYCKIYAFEPTQRAFQELKDLQLPNVTVSKTALSNNIGKSRIYFDIPGTALASMGATGYQHYGVMFDKEEEIDTTTLDYFCGSIGINRIDFCKIDVEGHEMNVLLGAKNLIANKGISFIQFEFGLASTHSGKCLKDFFALLKDYKIYRILQDGVYPIEYNERYEIFLTTNYLAVHKDFADINL